MKNKLLIVLSIVLVCTDTLYPIPPRLRNFGATCFLNATTQALYAIQPLTNYLVFQQRMKTYEPGSLGAFYVQLITALNTRSSQQELEYGGTLQSFADKAYESIEGCAPGEGCSFRQGCRQEDATEFLKSILTSFIEGDTRYRTLSEDSKLNEHPVAKLLAIHFTETIHCPSIRFTKQKTITPELYLFPAIQIAGGHKLSTLYECLDHYFQTEVLSDSENYYKLDLSIAELQRRPDLRAYNETRIPNCQKTTKVTNLGDIVIIALKRFAFLEEDYQGTVQAYLTAIQDEPELADYLDFPNPEDFSVKLDFSVSIPYQVNFRPYFATTAKKPDYYYELISAVHHSGDVGGGHYIAYVKDWSTSQWYECNDSSIRPVAWPDIQNDINESYIFIYQKNEKATIQKTSQPRDISGQALINALHSLKIHLNQLEQALRT